VTRCAVRAAKGRRAGGKGHELGAAALVESVHRAYLPARVLAFAEDVPIGEDRNRVDGPTHRLRVPESHV
jgi:hypothetical protein